MVMRKEKKKDSHFMQIFPLIKYVEQNTKKAFLFQGVAG